ncbi:MAG TPA: MFS transporter [Verrucomicrobiae bacterium]|nr:MFS transporter [Verrucomicrobiae bacterium]
MGPACFLILGAAGLRAVAISLSSVILSVYLAQAGFTPFQIAFAVSLGLCGCAAATFIVTFAGDRFGRRISVAFVGLLMAAGGLAAALSRSEAVLFTAFFIGMVNGMGRDRGASMTLDQIMLAQVTDSRHRTQTLAWYSLVVDSGNAVGAFLGIIPALLRERAGFSLLGSYQATWIFYGALVFLSGVLVLLIPRRVELGHVQSAPEQAAKAITQGKISAESRPLIRQFALISGLDSFGGGFLSTALLSYWFFQRFGVSEAFLGPFFLAARLANGISHLGAAWLAKRIGLVNTMVFTHLPSSLILMLVPLSPTLPIAVILFLLREALVEMDLPTRQSYIVAIVKEEERTLAAGSATLARNLAWAFSSMVAAPVIKALSLPACIYIGSSIKVVYDVLMYRAFRHVKPPEEA